MAHMTRRTQPSPRAGRPQSADREDLTPAAIVTLAYICRFQEKYAYPPSIRQIMHALRLRSTSTVHACLQRLQTAGYLAPRQSPRQLWRILKQPPGAGLA